MPIETKTDQNQNSDETESHADERAKLAGSALSACGGSEPPFAEKIPDADAEME